MSQPTVEMITLTIDGKSVSVPKGTNLIEAAKQAGIDIPHYCYHHDLSIAGNCRMCQVAIKGMPKLEIACNTVVRAGMEVNTGETSQTVADAQAATLEFILVNHPLDCTVCDQAGHCKLQDYHFEYNARPSRFIEEKVHKVKAEPLGPTVMLDGERCIMCTRCIRFCDEITKTSELGMLNRGDRSVISINPARPLSNALSGTVVDLCPVGALTHAKWRFNTRIWFTKQTDSVCPGCSTGCNVKVAERDGEIVQVKARYNSEVNKEWLCDEGRYGFDRFLPKNRITTSTLAGKTTALTDALKAANGAGAGAIFVAPDLLLEEYALLKKFAERNNLQVAIAYQERSLNSVEAILVSPDYAPNFAGAIFSGLVSGDLNTTYKQALDALKSGALQRVFAIGDRAFLAADQVAAAEAFKRVHSVVLGCDATLPTAQAAKVLLPARSILEKSGLLINRKNRLQYSERVVDAVDGSVAGWKLINALGGGVITNVNSERELTQQLLAADSRLNGLSLFRIKAGGIDLNSYTPQSSKTSSDAGATA